VGGDADRLVDHHEGIVVVHDPQALDDLWSHGRGGVGAGDHDFEQRPLLDTVRLRRLYAVESHLAGADQVGGLGAGEPEHPRDGGVDTFAREPTGHADHLAARRPRGRGRDV
jgi:hypothetical protein